jgi:hypothetical protein
LTAPIICASVCLLFVMPVPLPFAENHTQLCSERGDQVSPAQSIVFTRERSRITQGGSFLISVFNSRTIFFASFEPRDSGRLIMIAKEVTMSALSVGDLMNLRSATSVLGTLKHHSWQLHVNDFVPHRIQNQLDRGMKF